MNSETIRRASLASAGAGVIKSHSIMRQVQRDLAEVTDDGTIPFYAETVFHDWHDEFMLHMGWVRDFARAE